jgi:hypothetical protein
VAVSVHIHGGGGAIWPFGALPRVAFQGRISQEQGATPNFPDSGMPAMWT